MLYVGHGSDKTAATLQVGGPSVNDMYML